MEADFWHDRWREGQIGFHQAKPNTLLIDHLQHLELREGDRVFVPLCGKTLDIGWLRSQGFRISGAELSELAVQQLFEEMHLSPRVSDLGSLKLYREAGVEIFVGDIFDLTTEILGPVDAVYDRAALVALPLEMRRLYAAHLAAITSQSRQLLIAFDYDQSAMNGPPFSVSDQEVHSLYSQSFTLDRLSSREVAGGLKGTVPAVAKLWYLRATT